MKRGIAIVTMAALLGMTTPVAYASTVTADSSNWTVKAGDTLWKIAHSTGASIDQIEQANGITDPNMLRVGQILTIPSANPTTYTNYTVQSGDTLWKISQASGVTVASLLQANQLSNPDQLTIGQIVKIPVSTKVGSSSSYLVKSGDTLWKISQATGVSLASIEAFNSTVNPENLMVGTILTIPSVSEPPRVTLSLAQTTMVVNTSDSNLVTVHAYNTDGTPAIGLVLTPNYPPNPFEIQSAQLVTNSQGVAQYRIYEDGVDTGLNTVVVRSGSNLYRTDMSIISGVDPAQSTSSLPSNITLGQSYVVPVTVHDASGNALLRLVQSAFVLRLQGADGVYDVQGSVNELGSGHYQITFFTPGNFDPSVIASMENGPYVASLLVNGIQVGNSIPVNMTSANYPAKTQPDVAPNIALSFPVKLITNADAPSAYPLRVKLTDTHGNPVANQAVSFASSNTNTAVLQGSVATTDANGSAWIEITPGYWAGTSTITAISGTSEKTITVQSVAGPASIHISSPTSTLIENTSETATVTVNAYNADGSPAVGFALTNDHPFGITDANGQSSYTLPVGNAPVGSLPTSVSADWAIVSNTLTFSVIQGVDAAHSRVLSFPPTLVSSKPYVVDIYAADAQGNPITGLQTAAFQMNFPGSDGVGYSSLPTSVTDQGAGHYAVAFDPNTIGPISGSSSEALSLEVNHVRVGATTTVNIV